MPCGHYLPGELESIQREELDLATRLLCRMIARFGIVPGDAQLAKWKAEHDEMDRRR